MPDACKPTYACAKTDPNTCADRAYIWVNCRRYWYNVFCGDYNDGPTATTFQASSYSDCLLKADEYVQNNPGSYAGASFKGDVSECRVHTQMYRSFPAKAGSNAWYISSPGSDLYPYCAGCAAADSCCPFPVVTACAPGNPAYPGCVDAQCNYSSTNYPGCCSEGYNYLASACSSD